MPLNYHYFKNPYGKGATTGAIGTLFEANAKRYFEAIQNDIECVIGKDKKDGYIFKFKLPSESNPEYTKKLFYDVVLYFLPVNGMMATETTTIKDYEIYAFSNQISFIFTYTHAMNRLKALIPWIPYKFYSKDALRIPATTRNPSDGVYFDKGLWYCMFYITNNKLENKLIADSKLDSKCDHRYVINNIRTQVQMLELRQFYDKNYKVAKEHDIKRGYDKQKYAGKRNKTEYMKTQALQAKTKAKGMFANMKSSLKPKTKNPGR